MSNSCIICGSATEERSVTDTINYHEKPLVVSGLLYYHCIECGEEFADSRLHRHNSACFRDAKRAADGLLTSEQIVCLRKNYGINQQKASILFGGGPNSFSKYERGEVTQSRAMDKLLRVADNFPEVVEFLFNLEGLEYEGVITDTEFSSLTGDIKNSHELPILQNHRVLTSYDEESESYFRGFNFLPEKVRSSISVFSTIKARHVSTSNELFNSGSGQWAA